MTYRSQTILASIKSWNWIALVRSCERIISLTSNLRVPLKYIHRIAVICDFIRAHPYPGRLKSISTCRGTYQIILYKVIVIVIIIIIIIGWIIMMMQVMKQLQFHKLIISQVICLRTYSVCTPYLTVLRAYA